MVEQEFKFRIEIDVNVLCKLNNNAEIENKDNRNQSCVFLYDIMFPYHFETDLHPVD